MELRITVLLAYPSGLVPSLCIQMVLVKFSLVIFNTVSILKL